MSSIDFTARITKIERGLKKASIILKADIALHTDRFAAFDDFSRSGADDAAPPVKSLIALSGVFTTTNGIWNFTRGNNAFTRGTSKATIAAASSACPSREM